MADGVIGTMKLFRAEQEGIPERRHSSALLRVSYFDVCYRDLECRGFCYLGQHPSL